MQPINESTRALKECRLCRSSGLGRFIDFGQVPLGNNLQLTGQEAKEVEVTYTPWASYGSSQERLIKAIQMSDPGKYIKKSEQPEIKVAAKK